MIKKKTLLSAVTVTLLLLCGCKADGKEASVTSEALTEAASASYSEAGESECALTEEKLLECRFYDGEDFDYYDSFSASYSPEGRIRCGVVPHHLLAGKMTAGFFKAAAEYQDDIETVVIIAPIHEPNGNKMCTSLCGWQTPDGVLENDTELSEQFSDVLGAAEDDEMLQRDHSAAGLIPFVKRYLPSAEVSCLLVAGNAGNGAAEDISELLSDMAGQKSCLFVFSVDFSHYLSPDETRRHDKQTHEAVLGYDLEGIARMNNDNMDSPICIATFLRLSESLGAEVTELAHSDSLEISGLPYTHPSFENGLTSYFIFAAALDFLNIISTFQSGIQGL